MARRERVPKIPPKAPYSWQPRKKRLSFSTIMVRRDRGPKISHKAAYSWQPVGKKRLSFSTIKVRRDRGPHKATYSWQPREKEAQYFDSHIEKGECAENSAQSCIQLATCRKKETNFLRNGIIKTNLPEAPGNCVLQAIIRPNQFWIKWLRRIKHLLNRSNSNRT
jgi:hypothetical protein